MTKVPQAESNCHEVLQIAGLVYRIFHYLDIKTLALCRGVYLDWLYKGYNPNSLSHFSNSSNSIFDEFYDTETIFLLKDIVQFYRVEQIQLILWPISMNCIMSDLKYFGKLKNVFIDRTSDDNNAKILIEKNKDYCNFIIRQMLTTSSSTIEKLHISLDLSTVKSLQMFHQPTQDCNRNYNATEAINNICKCSNGTAKIVFPHLKKLFLGYSGEPLMNYIQFGSHLQSLRVCGLEIDIKFWYYLSQSFLYNLKEFELIQVEEMYSEQTMPQVIELARKVAKNMSAKVKNVMYKTEGASNKSPKLQFISALSEKGTIKLLDINIFADPIDLNSLSLTKTL